MLHGRALCGQQSDIIWTFISNETLCQVDFKILKSKDFEPKDFKPKDLEPKDFKPKDF